MIDSDTPLPAADDASHLARLRSLIDRVMADGKISPAEAHELRTALMADGQITPDEMDVIRTAIKAHLGDKPLEFE